MTIASRYRDLIALFPRFLSKRRVGWQGLRDILSTSGLERPALFLLIAIVGEVDARRGLSRDELERRLFNPYSTFDPIFDRLPQLVEKGYLSYGEDGGYRVTDEGREVADRVELGARAYLAGLDVLPPGELTRLATTLEAIAARLWQADEPKIKAHQARARRVPPITTDAPMVHLEVAIMSLWMARDDAHMAAWRAEGFSGPQMDLLGRVWMGEAQTVPGLITALERTQHAEDVVEGVNALAEAGYVVVEGERVTITDAGRQVRAWIEEETDRVYFSPWPQMTAEELEWVYRSLEAVCSKLGG